MMFKLTKKVIILLIIVITFAPAKYANAEKNKNSLLIIYDTYKEYLGETNNLNDLIKIALTTGNNIEIRNVESYTNENFNNYRGIIVLSNKEDSISKEKKDELYKYEEKLLWVDKFNFSNNKFLLDLKEEINSKFNVKDISRNCYVVLDEIYAFDDLNLIVEKVDYLYNSGIPFLINAMSVYENKHFDAMKRYTEVLRYAASKGGTVILGNPFLYDKGPTEKELIEKTGIAQDTFVNYSVYPVALTIDEYDLYRNDRKEYLNKASTIIINENENLGVLDFNKYSIKAFDNVLLKINVEHINELENLHKDIAIGLDSKYSMNEFINYIDLIKEHKIEISNPINLTSEISFGSNIIKNNNLSLTVNDFDIRGNKFISNEELFGTLHEEEKNEEINKSNFDLKNINKVIFVITITGGVIFIILFIGSLKIDKKKYFK